MTRTTPELAPPLQTSTPCWSSTGLAPFLGGPGQCRYSYAAPTGGRLAITTDLTYNRPHTRRIFSGIRFRTWNPSASKPKPYH
ncbi:hypothetical protein AVEN_188188-1 [Araneus ventricosus]|uniref:Uncharacterized protein n=1 Tax=Araneus ventricosus TaxID=182803 RepID=A0A4Y2DXV2_ARAVE|nr:hypothetical protein AVEN_85914-1 [Araneus ventricosus]GBM20435.1 hypothetical protein AVEN_188188-1 [Araneus ventricosus]